MARNQGIKSRNLVNKPVREGQRARAVNARAVAQVGTQRGNHITERAGKVSGDVETFYGAKKPAGGPGGVELGNSCALNVKGGGVGTGRTVYSQSGAQSTYSGQDLPPVVRKAPY